MILCIIQQEDWWGIFHLFTYLDSVRGIKDNLLSSEERRNCSVMKTHLKGNAGFGLTCSGSLYYLNSYGELYAIEES